MKNLKPKSKSKTGSRKASKKASEIEILPAEPVVIEPEVVEDLEAPEVDSDSVDFIEAEAEILPIEDFQREDFKEPSKQKSIVPYNPLDAYLAEIRRLPALSKEQEHETALAYFKDKDPKAAYKLVASNLWLVVKIARDYERVARNLLDLIQEGNIGLMEAVKNFDPYRGVRFPSYAIWWIKAYIIRFIIANFRLVKIGTTQAQRKLFFNLKKESERLEREGISPSPKLLADRLQVRESDVIEMSQRLGSSDVSVDAPLQADSDATLLSVLPSEQLSAEDTVAHKQMSQLLHSSLVEFEARLSERDKNILHSRIIDEDKKTLQELSDALGLSKERIRQLENRIREQLKEFMIAKAGSDLKDWLGTQEEVGK